MNINIKSMTKPFFGVHKRSVSILLTWMFLLSQFTLAGEEDSRRLFNDGWGYSEDYVAGKDIEASSWVLIDLPHTWNATDTVDAQPGYRRAAGWYKKRFKVESKADRYVLHFEGSNMETEVYLNGHFLQRHVGGYIGFDVELTEHIKSRGWNELVVKVSNEFNPNLIPSQKSDFFIHGGITRDVWLEYKHYAMVDRVEITTPEISSGRSSTTVLVELDSTKETDGTLYVDVFDSDGSKVASSVKSIQIKSGKTQHLVNVPEILNVKLWSPSSPNLYQVNIRLDDAKSSLDSTSIQYGFRWFEIEPGVGFKVNGERLLLRGTHRHEEIAGVGAAMTNEQHYADMVAIKNMGGNLVRLGHYPQDPTVYKAANELGLILWDELPWCRGGKGGEEWERNTEYLLEQQIDQNFNHPSIAFWSLGNEIYWEADFEGGGEDSELIPYLQKLNDYVKTRDSSRLTSIRKYYSGADIVDVFSPSIWAGWYGGAYGQYESALEEFIKRYPHFIHMEYGGSSHVGRHVESPIGQEGMLGAQVSVEEAVNQTVVTSIAKASDWNENYMVDLFDWHLMVSERFPGLSGTAQWAIRDFGTPLRPENPIPYVNQKGLFDRAGKPKDAYFVYASYWSEQPVCYIESHSWTVRYGPKEGREVNVYCNTQTAELFLNGKSLGERRRVHGDFPASGLRWAVPFEEGQNTLSVIGKDDSGKVTAQDEYTLQYYVGEPGDFERIELSTALLENGNVLIQAEAVDAEGRRITTFNDRVYFSDLNSVNGAGVLLGDYGTPTRSKSIEFASGYAAIEANLAAVNETVIEAKTQNFKGVYLKLDAKNFQLH